MLSFDWNASPFCLEKEPANLLGNVRVDIHRERKERERQEALERERVARLLADAERLRQADAIRAFLADVGRRLSSEAGVERYDAWSAWALAQADRIDPTHDLAFLGTPLAAE
jgi:hypothetical protein